MPNVLYAGLRNPERDQNIFNALAGRSISEVAELMALQPSTVRAAHKRIADLATFNLTLTGGVRTFRLALSRPSHSAARRWVHTATFAAPSAA